MPALSLQGGRIGGPMKIESMFEEVTRRLSGTSTNTALLWLHDGSSALRAAPRWHEKAGVSYRGIHVVSRGGRKEVWTHLFAMLASEQRGKK